MDNPKNEKPKKTSSSAAVKMADMGFRMVFIIGIGAFIGQKMDAYFAMNKPIFTIILCLLAIGGSMYMVIRAVSER